MQGLDAVAPRLSLRGVTKSFGDVQVLRGINMDIAPGEMVCLIGASGSGKSTLLRCMNGLEPVDDGEVLLDGVDIAEPGFDLAPIRQRIGIVFQSFNLFPHMTAYDNVALAPRRVLGED
ncbi:MAG: ATP-binding cassette domain-containing protein, partial [Pseudomonadota bacterium]